MNFTLCVLLINNDNGSVQTLCHYKSIIHKNGSGQTLCTCALCAKCLHKPIAIINQQYTKGEFHFINNNLHVTSEDIF